MPRAQLGKKLAGVERAGVDVGIVFGPVRAAGAAVDMDTLPVLQPRDQSTGPAFTRCAEPRRFDGKQVKRVKPVPAAIEAAQHLDEMIEITAVPLSAA